MNLIADGLLVFLEIFGCRLQSQLIMATFLNIPLYFYIVFRMSYSNTYFLCQSTYSNHLPPDFSCIQINYKFLQIDCNLFYISLLYNLYLFNSNIYSFSNYCSFCSQSCFVNCQYLNFSGILYFSNICSQEFDIIIIFNAITALTLQIAKVQLRNLYLMLKLFVFASPNKLCKDSHLFQNCCSFLLPGLSYFPTVFSTRLILLIFSTSLILPIFFTPLTFPILCFLALRTKKCNIIVLIYLRVFISQHRL